MLTKTLSEAKKKQRNILIKAMNNDIGSIDSAKDSWNPAQISERAKDISYIRSLVDTWNPAQLNEALKMLDLPIIDTWNPAQIEEQRRNLVFYLAERTLTGNPITIKILGNLTPEVTGLKVTMNPIQDLHGYSNPWAGGTGKNKLQNNATSATIAEVTYTVNSDGTIIANGTATANSNLYIYGTDSSYVDIGISAGNYIMNGGNTNSIFYVIRRRSGTNTNFTSRGEDVSLDIEEGDTFRVMVRVGSGVTVNNELIKPMIRLATVSDSSFAPYSNICPISGRTEASVTRAAGEDVKTKTHQYTETVWWATDDFANGGMEACGADIASYNGETLPGEWMSDRDEYAPGTTPTIGAQVVYKNTPTTISTSAEEITLLKGENVLSTDGDSIELKYKQNF